MLPLEKNPFPLLGFAIISVHVLCVIWFNLPKVKMHIIVIIYKINKDKLFAGF